MPKWVDRWPVEGSTGNIYTVAKDDRGQYACSCLGWTRHIPRKDCRHIRYIREQQPEPGWIEPIKVK